MRVCLICGFCAAGGLPSSSSVSGGAVDAQNEMVALFVESQVAYLCLIECVSFVGCLCSIR